MNVYLVFSSCTDWFTCVNTGALPHFQVNTNLSRETSLIETSHRPVMLVLELGLLFLLSLLHTAVSTCQKWDPSSQSKDQSLFLFFASGRFSARLSPYVIFLILRYHRDTVHSRRNIEFLIMCIKGEARTECNGRQRMLGLRHKIFRYSSHFSAAR